MNMVLFDVPKWHLTKEVKLKLDDILLAIPAIMDTPRGDIIERNFVKILLEYWRDEKGVTIFYRKYEEIVGMPTIGRYNIVEPRTRGFGILITKNEQKVLDDMLKEVQSLRDTPEGDELEMEFLKKLLDYSGKFFDTKRFWKEYKETIGDSTKRMNEILDREHARSGDTRPRFWWVPPPAPP